MLTAKNYNSKLLHITVANAYEKSTQMSGTDCQDKACDTIAGKKEPLPCFILHWLDLL